MGLCASSQEGALKAQAMRDPVGEGMLGSVAQESLARQQGEELSRLPPLSHACRRHAFTLLMLATLLMFEAIRKLPLDRLGEEIDRELGCGLACSLGEAGYLSLAGTCALLAGAFSDRCTQRPRALSLSMALCALLAGMTSACAVGGALLVARVFSAVVSSLSFPLILPLLVDTAHAAGARHYGLIVGILCLAQPLSSALCAFLSVVCSWRSAFATLSVLSLLVALLLALFKDPPRPSSKTPLQLGGLTGLVTASTSARKLLLHSRSLALLLSVQALLGVSYSALRRGLPAYFVHERRGTYAQVLAAEEALGASTFPLVVAVAAFSDRFVMQTGLSRIWVMIGFALAALVFLLPTVYSSSSINSAGADFSIVAFYILASSPAALNYLTIIDATPPHALGRALGLHALLVRAIGAFGIPLFDTFAEGKVLNEYSPFQACVLLFGFLPSLLAVALAIPAALSAAPSRLELRMHLGS